MSSPLLPSGKEALVLSLLSAHGDLYGLQLVDLSNGALKRGTVYVTLGRMQDKGLVTVLIDRDASMHAGLARPRYRVTTAGARVLQVHLSICSALKPARSRA